MRADEREKIIADTKNACARALMDYHERHGWSSFECDEEIEIIMKAKVTEIKGEKDE